MHRSINRLTDILLRKEAAGGALSLIIFKNYQHFPCTLQIHVTTCPARQVPQSALAPLGDWLSLVTGTFPRSE